MEQAAPRHRDGQIDLLRFLGLSMIILAHVKPPPWLFQLRNFDVPLMVFVSGLSAELTSADGGPRAAYFWKRTKRLAFPVWIFLTLYFLAVWLFGLKLEHITPKLLAGSYLLLDGIGYVWVIRVFLVIAILTPWLLALSRRVPNDTAFAIGLAAVTLAYEVVLHVVHPFIVRNPWRLVSDFVMDGIGYSLMFVIGARVRRVSRKRSLLMAVAWAAAFGVLAARLWIREGHFVQTQGYKYPPSLYYLSYAAFVSMLAYSMAGTVERGLARFPRAMALVLYIAQNTIWIYLLHIPVIKILESNEGTDPVLCYVAAYAIPLALVWAKNRVLDRALMPRLTSKRARANVRLVLTG